MVLPCSLFLWHICGNHNAIIKTQRIFKKMREELLRDLTEEQKAKLKECKSVEEMIALAKKEGVTLNEEQLTAISGGGCSSSTLKCPYCGSTRIQRKDHIVGAGGSSTIEERQCLDCHKWF